MTQLPDISADAKALAGAWLAGDEPLRFGMSLSRPTPRASAALNDLMAAKMVILIKAPRGVISYRAKADMRPFFAWLMARIDTDPSIRFPISERVRAPAVTR